MNRQIKRLIILVIVLIGINMLVNTPNTYGGYTDSLTGVVDVYDLPDTTIFTGFEVTITKANEPNSGVSVGEVLPGFCNNHNQQSFNGMVKAKIGTINQGVSDTAAFHYGHHLNEYQKAKAAGNYAEMLRWLQIMQYCKSNGFNHAANPGKLAGVPSEPSSRNYYWSNK